MKNRIFIPLGLLVLTACTQSTPPQKETPQELESKPVAEVNGHIITERQLQDRLIPYKHFAESAQQEIDMNAQKKKALDALIEEEIVLQEAVKEGVFGKSELLRREVMQEYFLAKIQHGMEQPSEDEIKSLYKKQKDTLDTIRVRHILIKPTNPKDPASQEAALKRAQQVRDKLTAQGEKPNFVMMVKEYSDDEATKNKGGDLSYFTYDKMVPKFSKAAFALQKVGEISPVVKTEFGYHIIQLTDDDRGYERNRNNLRMQLAMKKKKTLTEDLLEDLHDKSKVTIYKSTVANLSLE